MNVKAILSKRPLPLRITAAVIAFAMIGWLLWGANDLLGNPISYYLVKTNAEKYVAENYADKGYVLEGVGYNFKFKSYCAYFSKPGSEDCRFTAYYNANGKFSGTTSESRVLNGENTRSRLNERYRKLVDTVVDSPSFPFESDIAFGELIFERDSDEEHDFGLPQSVLAPDAICDITKLGEMAGLLVIYVNTEDVSPENAADILLEINSLMEQGGVPFYAIDLTLSTTEPDYADREHYVIMNFHRSDIYEDGLITRVENNHQQTEARWAELDKER